MSIHLLIADDGLGTGRSYSVFTRKHTYRGNSRKTLINLKKALERFKASNDRFLAYNATHENQHPTYYLSTDAVIIGDVGGTLLHVNGLLAQRTIG